MMNDVKLMGRITKDPEIRQAGNSQVASFSIAVEDDFKKDENGKRDTDFFDCEAWGSTAEYIGKYCTKGRLIVLSGKLKTDRWTDKDGNKRKAVKVVANSVWGADKPKTQDNNASYDNGGYNNNQPYQGDGPDSFVPSQGGGYNAPPAQNGGYNAPPAQNGGYNAHPAQNGGYNAPPAQNGGYNAPPAQNGGYNAPPAQNGGYNVPPAQNGGYNTPPVQNGGFNPAPAQSSGNGNGYGGRGRGFSRGGNYGGSPMRY